MSDRKKGETKEVQLNTEQELASHSIENLGGSKLAVFNTSIAKQVAQALWLGDESPHAAADEPIDVAIAGVIGIAPQDEMEGMLAAQILAHYNASMECHRRAMLPGQTFEGRNSSLAYANRCSRTFVKLLDALNRHRGKAQQKVSVEHVHVHEGGQAIVGNVEQTSGAHKKQKG